MGRVIIRWTTQKLIWMISQILKNKFDCFIIIEGNRGLGKSTLGVHLLRGVARSFKNEGSKDYRFNWKNSLIYTKKETKRFWHKWRTSGMADEMINVTFNRDFYNEEQKDIVKMINMNRDHCNFFIACVPQFQTLDSQIKNLCKIRITVVRRGMAVIQTPNRTIYVKDKWDQATNEKIERDWVKKGIKNPQYARLSTFRGLIKFPKLTDIQEEQYQKVKDEKRNLVAKEDMGLEAEAVEDPIAIAVDLLQQGKFRNSVQLEGYALAQGLTSTQLQSKMKRILMKKGGDHRISQYYWEKISKNKSDVSI